MDRTEASVRHMLTAIEAPLYDVGVLGDRGMHRIAEVHATSLKRLSKVETADDATDGAGEE